MVWKTNETDKKILRELVDNLYGLIPKSIIKYTGLKQSVVYKRLNLLEKNKLVERVDKVWKISNGQVDFCRKLLTDNNIFELHNWSFVIPLLHKPTWWNSRKNRLIKLSKWQYSRKDFGKNNSSPFEQISNEKAVIQTYPESIIVIFRKRFYSNNPYDVAIEGLNEVLDLIEWFEESMRFKFFKEGIPQVFIRNNDFNRLNDSLANHCKKEGTKFLVELDKNKKVWVDKSEPFGKESNYPEAQEILEKHTKDLLLNKPSLPSELEKNISILREETTDLSKVMLERSLLSKQVNQRMDEIQIQIVKLLEISTQINNRLNNSNI